MSKKDSWEQYISRVEIYNQMCNYMYVKMPVQCTQKKLYQLTKQYGFDEVMMVVRKMIDDDKRK